MTLEDTQLLEIQENLLKRSRKDLLVQIAKFEIRKILEIAMKSEVIEPYDLDSIDELKELGKVHNKLAYPRFYWKERQNPANLSYLGQFLYRRREELNIEFNENMHNLWQQMPNLYGVFRDQRNMLEHSKASGPALSELLTLCGAIVSALDLSSPEHYEIKDAVKEYKAEATGYMKKLAGGESASTAQEAKAPDTESTTVRKEDETSNTEQPSWTTQEIQPEDSVIAPSDTDHETPGAHEATPERRGFVHTIRVMWATFRSWRRRRRLKPGPARHPALPPDNVSHDVLVARLDPKGWGHDDGLRNDPPNPGLRSGTGEIHIVGFINDMRRAWENHANYWIHQYNDSLHDSTPASNEARIRATVADTKQRMTDRAKQGDRNLEEFERQIRDAEKSRDAAGERYGITGEPEQGYSRTLRLTHISILAAVLLLEAGINGWLIGILMGGVLDGLVFSIAVALVNGLVGFFPGHIGKPLANQRNATRRFWGRTMMLIAGVILVVMNALVGYYRDVLAGEGIQLQSYVMTLVGMAAASWAFMAGWFTTSPHPEYLDAYDRCTEQRKAKDREEDQVRHDLTSLKRQAYKRLGVGSKTANTHSSSSSPRSSLPMARKAQHDARAKIRELEDNGEEVVALYRSANETARGGGAPDIVWTPVTWAPISIDEIQEPSPRSPIRPNVSYTPDNAIIEIEAHHELLSRERPWLRQNRTPSE